MDRASAVMQKYLDFAQEFDDINTESANMGVKDLVQSDLDDSKYSDLVPTDVVSALTFMKSTGDAIVGSGAYVPAVQAMAKMASRR